MLIQHFQDFAGFLLVDFTRRALCLAEGIHQRRNISCVFAAGFPGQRQPVVIVRLIQRHENAARQIGEILGRGCGSCGFRQPGNAGIGNLVCGIRIGERIDAGAGQFQQFHDRRNAARFLEQRGNH